MACFNNFHYIPIIYQTAYAFPNIWKPLHTKILQMFLRNVSQCEDRKVSIFLFGVYFYFFS